jgi:hypothetical protein
VNASQISWFFDLVPYILAVGAILLGAAEIIKDWADYKSKWLRMIVAAVFVVVALASIASLHHDRVEKANAAMKSEGDMKTLQGKVDAAKQAQEDNTKLFLSSMGKMSDQVSDLRTEVKTEALQKKLASVQAELLKTQRALEPGPKAELSFTFAPYPNTQSDVAAVTEITLPRNEDGSVHIEFSILNLSAVDAIGAAINVLICNGCQYAKEPQGLSRLAGMGERARFLSIHQLHAKEAYTTVSIDVIPPPVVTTTFTMGIQYRCNTCVLRKEVLTGTIHIAPPSGSVNRQ